MLFVADDSATLLAPGRVKHPGAGVTHIGELDGKTTPRLEAAAKALRGAGFTEKELNMMFKDNPAKLVKLPVLP